MNNTEQQNHKILAWFMWVLTTLFFAYQFILRLSSGLIISEIMTKFKIDATEYSMLSAMYYFGYAGMQIPVALLIDHFGSRVVGFACALICALSSLVFIYTDNWTLLLICRFLIGVGSAAGFLNASKVISMWFPPKVFGRMVGFTFSLGLVGAVYGGKPISVLMEKFGWVNVLQGVGIAGIVISMLILFFVRNKTNILENEEEHVLTKLKKIVLDWRIVLMAIANLLMVGSLEGFVDVWGVSYFMKLYGLSKPDAAYIVYFTFIGMIVGAPLLAYIADKTNMHYGITALCGLGIAIIFFIIIGLQTAVPANALYLVMFITGIFCCYQVLIFAIISMRVKPSLVNITVAFMNCINMSGGLFFHPIIGNLMDHFWQGQMEGGVRIYGLESYNYSLLVIPVAALIGSLIFVAVKAKQQLKT